MKSWIYCSTKHTWSYDTFKKALGLLSPENNGRQQQKDGKTSIHQDKEIDKTFV